MTRTLIALVSIATTTLITNSAHAVLLISDDFNTANSGLTANNNLATRQSGSLATVNWANAKAVHNIVGNRVQSNEAASTGRAFLQHDFVNAAITNAGGFVVEYDFIPGPASGDWINLGLGLKNGPSMTPGTMQANGNLVGVVDFGLLLRNQGGFQVFQDNSATPITGGGAGSAIASPVVGTPYQVKLTVQTTSFAAGASATASAVVDGNILDLNGAAPGTSTTFTWDADATNLIAWESNQDVSFFDNVAISTIMVPEPSTLMLAAFGALCLLRGRRRTR